VPEISVNKHSNLGLKEDEVRPSKQFAAPPPPANAELAAAPHEPKLRGLVATAPDSGHDPRPFGCGEAIGAAPSRLADLSYQLHNIT
jgi:hypothetical protein